MTVMNYKDFYDKVSAIVKENYSEVNVANKVIATLEQFRLDRETAEQSVQETKARCICVDFINCNPDPIPNPDCPIHGAGFAL